ncbi:hypothetical protein [Pelagibacterium halotolerans]|uniref:hypothetical protein n=1 Tax=Pelagibacterium halotolerans TaxID=531813 RepID=UPI00384AE089
MSVDWPWSALGIDEPASDPRVVRRAYAQRLKQIDSERDVSAFQALRSAYQAALRQAGEARAPGGHGSRQIPSPVPPIVAPEPAPPVPDTDAGSAHAPGGDAPARRAPMPMPVQSIEVGERETLLRLLDCLEAGDLDLATWEAGLIDPEITETPGASAILERAIVTALDKTAAEQRIPDRMWLRLIAGHFEWQRDGVGFLKRFPGRHDLLNRVAMLLGAKRSPAPRRGTVAKPLPLILRWHFLTIILLLAQGLAGTFVY